MKIFNLKIFKCVIFILGVIIVQFYEPVGMILVFIAFVLVLVGVKPQNLIFKILKWMLLLVMVCGIIGFGIEALGYNVDHGKEKKRIEQEEKNLNEKIKTKKFEKDKKIKKKELKNKKNEAKKIITEMTDLTESDKKDFLDQISEEKSVKMIEQIVSTASSKNENNKLERIEREKHVEETEVEDNAEEDQVKEDIQVGGNTSDVDASKSNLPTPSTTKSTKIKGSVNGNKYHHVGCRFYDRIKDYNAVYFNSESDAISAGRIGCKSCS